MACYVKIYPCPYDFRHIQFGIKYPFLIVKRSLDYISERGYDRASASAETKRKASMIDEAVGAGLTDEEIRQALAKLAAKKAKK